ncbi:HMA2 domain-containing protein [Pelosinus sp. sgz500959]|uniref:HMA2 domain-containing protein n=1 Tax=Pelosinus sp. sgz500959 TaxID=3242472 RepID=UPI0036727CC2
MQMKNSSTSLGLAISLVGSLLTIGFNKKYHIAFGVMLTALAGVHSLQHRNSLVKYLHGEVSGMKGIFTGCANFFNQKTAITFLSQHVQVLHYVPGRVRLYSHQLLNNLESVQQVKEYLDSIREIHSFSINPATGSVLIQYSPEDVASQPLLKEVENLVARQYGRR